jgi:deoxyadenosine/deoxycytidine kinase
MTTLSKHVCIEGNIGVGKTSFLLKLSEKLTELNISHEMLVEPVDQWVSFGKGSVNLLEKMYHEPTKFSYDFQMAALITKNTQLQSATGKNVLVERSIAAQKNIFLPILLKNKAVTSLQYEICERYMDFFMKIPGNIPDVIVYLRSSPAVVLDRIATRGRTEERDIRLEYLETLHHHYERWLMKESNVIVVDADDFSKLKTDEVFQLIQDKIKLKE